MAGKITAFILTLLLNIVAGVLIFFVMILAMNGFSEADANYGLGAYIVLTLVVSITMAILSFLSVGMLVRRNFGSIGAAVISVLVFSFAGAGLKVVCAVVGILIADYARVNY